jgi:hypothetical protein
MYAIAISKKLDNGPPLPSVAISARLRAEIQRRARELEARCPKAMMPRGTGASWLLKKLVKKKGNDAGATRMAAQGRGKVGARGNHMMKFFEFLLVKLTRPRGPGLGLAAKTVFGREISISR